MIENVCKMVSSKQYQCKVEGYNLIREVTFTDFIWPLWPLAYFF